MKPIKFLVAIPACLTKMSFTPCASVVLLPFGTNIATAHMAAKSILKKRGSRGQRDFSDHYEVTNPLGLRRREGFKSRSSGRYGGLEDGFRPSDHFKPDLRLVFN